MEALLVIPDRCTLLELSVSLKLAMAESGERGRFEGLAANPVVITGTSDTDALLRCVSIGLTTAD